MKSPPKPAQKQKSQKEKFIETAKEHGCDLSEEQFKKALKKIVVASTKAKPNR